MPASALDVLAVGSAIVDVHLHCSTELLADLGLVKSATTVIDSARAEEIYAAAVPTLEVAGGPAANTATGVTALGGAAAYVGRVADDPSGRLFVRDLQNAGVGFRGRVGEVGLQTARRLILWTPDLRRTTATCPGTPDLLTPEGIQSELCRDAAVLYFDGQLVGNSGHAALHAAADASRKAGRLVALNLSDPTHVLLHREAFRALLPAVDVLFANQEEALALTGAPDARTAVRDLRRQCTFVTVTNGAHGALVAGPRGAVSHVPARAVDHVVDSTGAGDLFAAGFLFGLTRGLPHSMCADLGCLAASEIITHPGARSANNPLTGLLGPRRSDNEAVRTSVT